MRAVPGRRWLTTSSSTTMTTLIVVLLATGVLLGAAASSQFSVPGQRRTRTCTPFGGERLPLLFPDGTPTGFYALSSDPSQQGGTNPCKYGNLELDAQETLRNATGEVTYFHPGGGPDHYRNYVDNGQYGHVSTKLLKVKPAPAPQNLNGKVAPLKANSDYYITPTIIPHDMWYKPNVVNGSSGSTYYTYGNPGFDKTGGRGDWTYICWSWVQNGGNTYSANITSGGGLVRALGKRNNVFHLCDVNPIQGYSYGADNQINGRVTAVYGKTFAGPGEHGSAIYGWVVDSYQKNGQAVVPCLRRVTSNGITPQNVQPRRGVRKASDAPADDRASRMAANLLDEVSFEPAALAECKARYASSTDAAERMELLTEMSRADDAAVIDALIDVLARERDPRVREQAIVLLGFMRSTEQRMPETCVALAEAFRRSDDATERERVIDFAVTVGSPQAVAMLRDLRGGESSGVLERIALAQALFRLAPRVPVDASTLQFATHEIHELASTATDAEVRLRAVQALATPGQDHQSFLTTRLQSETSPQVRQFLSLATDPFPIE